VGKAKPALIKHFITREHVLKQSSFRQTAAQSKVCELGSLILTNWSETVASERGQGKKEKIHTHQTPRCIPGRHGEAVPARPTRRGRGKSSLSCTGSTTPWHFHRRTLAEHKHLSMLNSSASSSGEAPHRGCSEAADPERGDQPDLLREEAAGDSVWWSW
jgi:hypothetical protein